jgi:hypothetical protein
MAYRDETDITAHHVARDSKVEDPWEQLRDGQGAEHLTVAIGIGLGIAVGSSRKSFLTL